MVVVSLGCAVQETSSVKSSVLRTSLAPQKSARRSLDVSAHVLATPVTPADTQAASLAGQPSHSLQIDASLDTHWTPTWKKAIQTKFSSFWDKWQKISTQLGHYKALRPDWMGHTQELLDQQLQRFLCSVGAMAAERPASAMATSTSDSVSQRPVTLTPYLTVADEVEVSFAAMLADLCNMAYDVDHLDPELLESRHRLSLIATSCICRPPCDVAASDGPSVRPTENAAQQGQDPKSPAEASAIESEADALNDLIAHSLAPSIVAFTMGGSPPLSPSISMLQLTSPEAVTAALTSQGHGAAFARPVFVSTLHQGLHPGLASMGSYDEEGDISDLELRSAMAGGAPHALFLGAGMVGSLGTMGTMDDIPPWAIQSRSTTGGGQGSYGGPAHTFGPYRGPAATLVSDFDLNEERDFLAGHVYGYNTQPVERRGSVDNVLADEDEAVAPPAVTRRGAAGGRALRDQQSALPGSMAGVEEARADTVVAGGMPGLTSGPPVVVASSKKLPNAWFSCDDKLSKTRYFSIQGSTSLEHWQINLQFEPVVFEDPKYGVRIHRGVYEAAKELYAELLPLVQQHLETSPYATVSFTGHSLGGSLAAVLMLLFVVRGVVKLSNIAPVYTFGAPAVFCQGAVADAPSDRCAHCTLQCEMRPGHGEEDHATREGAAGLGLLTMLGLTDDHVVNVIMHKDIVPRAFVCDYTAVAGMLHHWWPELREHGEMGEHKSLYNFIGRVAVLRPSADMPFVHGSSDAAHPMLPNHPALYRVGVPDQAMNTWDPTAASLASWDELIVGLSAMAASCQRSTAAAATRRAAKLESMQKSMLQFMNQPHPLTILSDYQAYGPQGYVSRFHNPDNYTRALKALSGR